MWQALTILGYITLVGPPRAVLIKANATREKGELYRLPLFWVIAIEFLIRLGLFIVLGSGTEAALGDSLFERYQIDVLLAALLVAGGLHTAVYTLCFCFLGAHFERATKIYRAGRNMAYAIIPAFPAAGTLLVLDTLSIMKLDDALLTQVFLGTWAVFFAAAIVESAIMKRQPRGLGEDFKAALALARSRPKTERGAPA